MYDAIDVSASKSAQKNKKRRAKKKQKEPTNPDVENDEVNEEEPAPVVEELSPIELIKQKIEEAKLAKVRLTNLCIFMHTFYYSLSIFMGSEFSKTFI